MTDEGISVRVGLLGELEVELQLVRKGWHPVRLDTAQMASNADLLAINRTHRVSLQVKTTDAENDHSHSDCLGFGYANGYLREAKSIFNSKESPLIADVIVGVNYRSKGARFVVMPVSFAEALCRLHCDYWSNVLTGNNTTRSPRFPIYLNFNAQPNAHAQHHARIRRNLLAFEDKWDVLLEPIERLHHATAWPLLD